MLKIILCCVNVTGMSVLHILETSVSSMAADIND